MRYPQVEHRDRDDALSRGVKVQLERILLFPSFYIKSQTPCRVIESGECPNVPQLVRAQNIELAFRSVLIDHFGPLICKASILLGKVYRLEVMARRLLEIVVWFFLEFELTSAKSWHRAMLYIP